MCRLVELNVYVCTVRCRGVVGPDRTGGLFIWRGVVWPRCLDVGANRTGGVFFNVC